MDPKLMDKLQKILALTTSPVEGEAQAASAMLQKFLTKHNLDIADLERRGTKTAPGIKEEGHDLGKAAFRWKLYLASGIADHFFCHAFVYRKQVSFVGRPDNVDSLKMLYEWLINQIRLIAREERRKQATHINPLRWQIHFGEGAVSRLVLRLEEIRRAQSVEETALVVAHKTEISDWLEANGRWRVDGKRTAREEKWAAEWEKRREEDEELLRIDPVAYYEKYPQRHPDAKAKAEAKWERKWERQRRRAEQKQETPEERRKREQSNAAWYAGNRAAENINLSPFLGEGK